MYVNLSVLLLVDLRLFPVRPKVVIKFENGTLIILFSYFGKHELLLLGLLKKASVNNLSLFHICTGDTIIGIECIPMFYPIVF